MSRFGRRGFGSRGLRALDQPRDRGAEGCDQARGFGGALLARTGGEGRMMRRQMLKILHDGVLSSSLADDRVGLDGDMPSTVAKGKRVDLRVT